MKVFLAIIWISIVCVTNFVNYAWCIQCYSCQATASNEIEANIHCLETANVEDCNDFYQYYADVESDKTDPMADNFDYYDVISGPFERQMDKSVEYNGQATATGPRKRIQRHVLVKRKVEGTRGKGGKSTVGHDEQSSYDYPAGVEEYQTLRSGEKLNNSDETDSSKMKMPTDPEHFCYSSTKKSGWENYVVEKGCKKIIYCRAHEENLPDWSMPWNFCCDKSRCNAKLVRDKPQRIFGMGCRRTDDCIQGHNSRHVCPEMFQSCPKVSMNVVKMECRTKLRSPPSLSRAGAGHSYFQPLKEKKCFCAKGYYPKGPICTNKATSVQLSVAMILTALLLRIDRDQ